MYVKFNITRKVEKIEKSAAMQEFKNTPIQFFLEIVDKKV